MKEVENEGSRAEIDQLRAELADARQEIRDLNAQNPQRARWRPCVTLFADAMEGALRRNDAKGGWEDDDPEWLLGRLKQETRELETELVRFENASDSQKTSIKVLWEAADVANFAMMIADRTHGLGGSARAERVKHADEPSPTVEAVKEFLGIEPRTVNAREQMDVHLLVRLGQAVDPELFKGPPPTGFYPALRELESRLLRLRDVERDRRVLEERLARATAAATEAGSKLAELDAKLDAERARIASIEAEWSKTIQSRDAIDRELAEVQTRLTSERERVFAFEHQVSTLSSALDQAVRLKLEAERALEAEKEVSQLCDDEASSRREALLAACDVIAELRDLVREG